MSRRYFSNTAAQAITTNPLNNTDSASTISLTVPLAGWPASTPFLAALDKGTATEEIVQVTAVSGSNITASRGFDNSPKRTHGIGATLQHVASAIDYDEANAHVNSTSGVHGAIGSVVGATDAQTLTNKTLTQPIIGDLTNAQHDHSAASHGGAVPQASITGLAAALAALETQTQHNIDVGLINGNIATNDGLAVHKAGTETVTGDKTFSGTVSHTGPLHVTANSGNQVPVILGTAGVLIFANNYAFSLSSQSSTTIPVTFSGFTTLAACVLTVEVGSGIRLDAQLDVAGPSGVTIRVRQSENVAVTASGNVHLFAYGR